MNKLTNTKKGRHLFIDKGALETASPFFVNHTI